MTDDRSNDLAEAIGQAGRRHELEDPDIGLGAIDRWINRIVEAIGVTALVLIVLTIFANALGRYAFNALLFVVIGLWHGGVGLVRTRGANAFILIIDLGRCIERFLQAACAKQGRRSPFFINITHLIRNFNPRLLAHLLHNQRHREKRG